MLNSYNRKAHAMAEGPARRPQHVVTLLGATCHARLATRLQSAATCWVLLVQV